MAAPVQKLNILIYTGPGASATCISQTLYTLRALLSPTYAVGPISLQTLLKEPWQSACALLVFPGGADSPYCAALGGSAGGIRRIAGFVRQGGKYLGLCAGGYFGSSQCEFEVGDPLLEVIGKRELAFFPGTCRGGVFKGFQYSSEFGARAAKIKPSKEHLIKDDGDVPDMLRCYCNGGGVFVDAAKMKDSGIDILAHYEEEIDVDGGDGKAAVVYCKVGDGAAVLMGPHPEFAAALLPRHPEVPHYDDLLTSLREDDQKRLDFLGSCFRKLGLTVDTQAPKIPAHTEMHLSGLEIGDISELLHILSEVSEKDGAGLEVIKAENDTFRFIKNSEPFDTSILRDALPVSPSLASPNAVVPRDIIPHESSWPSMGQTPEFDHGLYYSSLYQYRLRENRAKTWGSQVLYASVLSSTNTILDKNPKFLSKLPSGFTVIATTQTSGRGRGNNVWVSPKGSLIFSTVVNHPAHLAMTKPIVFLQYLAAIAIVEGIKSYSPGRVHGDMPVKLKWPNDIYARNPEYHKGLARKDKTIQEFVKIGGILSSCNYEKGNYQVVLGIGINTTNAKPTTSLNALLEEIMPQANQKERDPRSPQKFSDRCAGVSEPYTIERLVARIITRLEALYERFCDVGFSKDIEARYYSHWLHSGQEVTVHVDASEKVPSWGSPTGPMRARVEGITTDWGMLKVRELDADGRPINRTWALQSDENSFDYWKGLIRRKI